MSGNQTNELSDEQSESDIEDLNALLSDINNTTDFVLEKVDIYKKELESSCQSPSDPSSSSTGSSDNLCVNDTASSEEIYVEKMSDLQFGEFDSVRCDFPLH